MYSNRLGVRVILKQEHLFVSLMGQEKLSHKIDDSSLLKRMLLPDSMCILAANRISAITHYKGAVFDMSCGRHVNHIGGGREWATSHFYK